MNENPLLYTGQFALYDKIEAKHFVPAINSIVEETKKKFVEIRDNGENPRTFMGSIMPLIQMNEKISQVIVPMYNLFSLNATSEIKDELLKAQQIFSQFSNEFMMDPDHYKIYKDFSSTEEASNLSVEKERYLQNKLKSFCLSGAELDDEKKLELQKINLKLVELTTKYSNNIVESTYDLVIEEEKDLKGLPEDTINQAKEVAKAKGKEKSWIFTLDYPSYLPFMRYADNDDLRKKLWSKFLNRATEGKNDNRKLIPEILRLRRDLAKLLGFKSFAEYSLATKMAKTPEQIQVFLTDIADRLKPAAKNDLKELLECKSALDNKDSQVIDPWSHSYWSNKLKEDRYSYSEEEVKPYFAMDNCIENGIFKVANLLYGLTFEEVHDIPTWHKDVKTYKIFDKDKNLRSYIYFDMHPRTGLKRSGAWMNQLKTGYKKDNIRIPSIVSVNCNFTEPIGDKPALLTYNELTTLFHEFGHALHGALTSTELSETGGTSVQWDVVELPSTIMENFVKKKEGLMLFAHHYQNGEVMPDSLMQKLIESEKFQRATFTITQIIYGMFDMNLHHDELLGSSIPDAADIYEKIYKKFSLFPFIKDTHFETGFAHVFAGGYSAGYYSYMWANILEADAFSKYEESGKILNPEIGKSFMENILEKGDSEDMNILFERFRGRPYTKDALLKRLGV